MDVKLANEKFLFSIKLCITRFIYRGSPEELRTSKQESISKTGYWACKNRFSYLFSTLFGWIHLGILVRRND
ncbi:hypothetical protein BGZ60DRAFT_111214 [Tricladium varicosporioides]|nr:hypothetical protein BGZ60DRAFT_111214 [Hymenoscyphus varicosporioides]